MFKFGDKLKNGAEVIDFKANADHQTVLAKWTGHQKFVTWRVDQGGNTYLGHYFTQLGEAVADFNNR